MGGLIYFLSGFFSVARAVKSNLREGEGADGADKGVSRVFKCVLRALSGNKGASLNLFRGIVFVLFVLVILFDRNNLSFVGIIVIQIGFGLSLMGGKISYAGYAVVLGGLALVFFGDGGLLAFLSANA